ncbi:uncharacterized protein [Oscarella lobularis]|uniref:uncharacterized protein isoform X2 n=1 Tax=Oscarella lobularis TaxID=121494 RepID=UPI003313E9A3
MASKKLIGSRMVMNRDLPRPSSTTSIRDDPGSKKGWTGSSSYVHELERQVKLLKLENAQLEQKLDEKTLLLEQLASESSGESFDQRRIYLLKSQIVQLERQLHLFATSLQRQATLMVKMDNFLTDLVEKTRSSSDTVLKELRQSAEVIIHSMQTGDEVGVSAERLAQPLYFPNAFQHPKRNQPITFLDICGPSLDHINLKQVAYLESSLASLHRKLISLKSGLSTVPPSVSFLTPIESHGLRQFDDVIITLEQCCTDLLNLSLLIPTAPWALPKTQSFTTAKDIEELLPSFPKRKQEVNKVLDAVVKTFDHRHTVAEMELDVLKVELEFHQSVYKLQLDYVKSLFESINHL